jgi:cell division protein FtsQ
MNALLRIAAWLLAVTLVGLPIFAVLNGWIAGSRWPMRQLVVTGEFRQVSDTRVRSAVMPLVQDGFFAVDLDQVRVELAKLPWVQRVEVRKRWPDRLEVSLVEYKPLARWGSNRMLSENGELFPAPKGLGANLPLFDGPDSRASDLIAFHRQLEPDLVGRLRDRGRSRRPATSPHPLRAPASAHRQRRSAAAQARRSSLHQWLRTDLA